MTTNPDLMTVQEVAEFLRTPAETVRYWRHVGKGPKSFKVGRRVLYAREDVEAYLAELRPEKKGVTEVVASDQPRPYIDVSGYDGFMQAVKRMETFNDARCGSVHPMAETIARAIEETAQYEGPRAQRVIKMCAEVARKVGRQ